jgi:enoyl-CoA hydratase/carnithine racemase
LASQLEAWCESAALPGVVYVVFDGPPVREELGWLKLERWTRSRAVTVADLRSNLGGAALDVALCADLVYVREGIELLLPASEPSPGLLWALGRAGRAALSRGLLDESPISAGEAVRLGLAQGELGDGEEGFVPDGVSLVALTTARDLMRSSVGARSTLERASFRLLFASGDPGEGARAFFERRPPDFEHGG